MVEAFAAVYGPAVPRNPQISLEGIERDAALYPAHPRAPDFAKVTRPAIRPANTPKIPSRLSAESASICRYSRPTSP